MATRWRKIVQLIELARFDLLFSVISNTWLITFLAFRIEPRSNLNPGLMQLGLFKSLVITAVVSGGLVGFALALRDVLNARHDRAFAPARPIPSGRVHIQHAAAAAVLSLIIALTAALSLGKSSTVIALLASGGILFYNLAGRFIPAVGIVCLGLIHVLIMAIVNPYMSFAWPIILTMSHSMACATLRYFLAGKRPRISRTDGGLICIGWAFWTLVVIGLMSARGGTIASDYHLIWVGPTLASLVFVICTWQITRGRLSSGKSRRLAANRFVRLSVLWLMVYDACWLFSAGLWYQSAAIAGLFISSVVLSRIQLFVRLPISSMSYSLGMDRRIGSDG